MAITQFEAYGLENVPLHETRVPHLSLVPQLVESFNLVPGVDADEVLEQFGDLTPEEVLVLPLHLEYKLMIGREQMKAITAGYGIDAEKVAWIGLCAAVLGDNNHV